MAFAFNYPVPIIETNIRTVYIHFFFDDHGQIHDKELMPLIEKTLDKENPRDWYYALMDYGVMLKKTIGNVNKKSRHYTKQSTFKGSNREQRAKILHFITEKPASFKKIIAMITKDAHKNPGDVIKKTENNILALEQEGFIKKVKAVYYIHGSNTTTKQIKHVTRS